MKYMPRSVWGLLWLLNFLLYLVQCLGCFCLLINIFALAVNKEHFPVGMEQCWGYGGEKEIPLATCTTSSATLQLSICHLLLHLTFGIFLFPSPVACPCHVLALLCHFKQLCVCQAGFSQQLCDKELCFAKVRMCLFSPCQAAEAAAFSPHVGFGKAWRVKFPGLTQLLSAQLWEQSG